ncbi:MAG: hypothetical protein LBQ08_03205 [Holosporaceae bacterium]|jgi:hypothetical protein|nr:hypothetical protein [Holosporaceae bacterium]
MKFLIGLFRVTVVVGVIAVGVYFFGNHQSFRQMFQDALDHIKLCINLVKEHI